MASIDAYRPARRLGVVLRWVGWAWLAVGAVALAFALRREYDALVAAWNARDTSTSVDTTTPLLWVALAGAPLFAGFACWVARAWFVATLDIAEALAARPETPRLPRS